MTSKTGSCSFLNAETRTISLRYLEALDTPVSLGIFLCLKHKDDISACSHSISPAVYLDPDSFGKDYLAVCLLSKYRDGPKDLSSARKDLALTKFWSCEDYLREVQPRLKSVLYGNETKYHTLQSKFYSAREKIAQILGPVRSAFCVNDCKFGPGSSSSIPRHKAHPSQKYVARDVTASCASLREWFLSEYGLDYDWGDPNIIEYSRVTVVPKSFKSDRVIAIEPDWNIFFQKGFGSAIRRRLKRVGLDLDNGWQRNAQLAKQGSIDNSLATIDLSSASDSIMTSLVRFLLPEDWFYCLSSLRTTFIEQDGILRPLVKFSSMGNGFTFELESLIFYGLALASLEHSEAAHLVSVFGDDIILPIEAVDCFEQILDVAGFRVNPEKSYTSGGFRESCGSHYFLGRDVKPFFLKDKVSDDVTRFKTCNAIRRVSFRFGHYNFSDSPFLQSYVACRNNIRRVFRIPEGYGDGGLVSSFDEACPSTVRRSNGDVRKQSHCIEGYKVRCLQNISARSSDSGRGMYIHKLRELEGIQVFGVDNWVVPSDLNLLWYSHRLAMGIHESVRSKPAFDSNDYFHSARKISMRVGFMKVQKWNNPESLA